LKSEACPKTVKTDSTIGLVTAYERHCRLSM